MIKINLLPETTERKIQSSFLRDLLILGSLCFGIWYGMEEFGGKKYDDELTDIDTKIAAEQQTRSRMKKEFEQTKEKRERAEAIRVRGNSIKRLGEGRKIPVVLLDSLQIKHPERMWFNKLSYKNSASTLTIQGYALDHTVIAEYLKKLKEIGKIDASDIGDLRSFIPPQLLNSGMMAKNQNIPDEKNEIKALEDVTLKSLQSEDVEGVTLQKFEITIRLQNG